jgi:oxalate decarboxylase
MEYYLRGKGRMTVFNTGPNAITMDFNAGDIGYVKKNLGHYVENVGDTDPAVYRGLQGFPLPRDFSVQLANAHAASIGRPASQCRRGDNC